MNKMWANIFRIEKKSFTSVIVICLTILMLTLNLLMDNLKFNVSKLVSPENTSEPLPTRSHNRTACKLPLHIDPFDKSVKPYIEKLPNKIICKQSLDSKNDFLTFISSNNTLMINSSDSVKCSYQFFTRVNGSDNRLLYHKSGRIDPISGTPMKENEFVNVSCFRNNKKVYKNFHYVIPNKKNKTDGEYHPSVFILVIESMSRINFIRHMPKTRRELERLGNITYLKGLTKIDDNSYPNMIALLTGKLRDSKELPNYGGPYDYFPLIWKKFELEGYSTAIIEDSPDFTLFNYHSKGFVKGKPTNFYPRPFWIHLEKSQKMKSFGINFCSDNKKPIVDIFLDQVKAHIEKNSNKLVPSFTFAFLIEITHNYFNQAQYIDQHYARFLRTLSKNLKDGILILMGDHGNRMGSILHTDIGRIEERMPLFAIRLPEKLGSHHPHLNTYLTENSDKLVTWLDVHQLLLDIVDSNYTPYTRNQTYYRPEVYSPWRHLIPYDRTCSESLIPGLYCMCNERKLIETHSNLVRNATNAFVRHMNTILPSDLCETFTLKSITKAYVIIPNEETDEQTLEITITVNPSKAELRAQVFRKNHTHQWYVNDVNRINKYGNQSHCIKNVYLKKFCYCKNQLHN